MKSDDKTFLVLSTNKNYKNIRVFFFGEGVDQAPDSLPLWTNLPSSCRLGDYIKVIIIIIIKVNSFLRFPPSFNELFHDGAPCTIRCRNRTVVVSRALESQSTCFSTRRIRRRRQIPFCGRNARTHGAYDILCFLVRRRAPQKRRPSSGVRI